VAEGALPKLKVWDPFLQILSERGAAHEQSYVEHLKKAGLDVVRIDGIEVTNAVVAETHAAVQRGVPVIAQAALSHQGGTGAPTSCAASRCQAHWAAGLMSLSTPSLLVRPKQGRFCSYVSMPTCSQPCRAFHPNTCMS
jgi:hypothetical protein